MTDIISKFNIHYFKTPSKTSTIDLLEALKSSHHVTSDDELHNYNPFHIRDLQYYNPVYTRFFNLSDANYNRITLNHKYHIQDMSTIIDQDTKQTIASKVFIKFSPLLDPVRYMIGKYNIEATEKSIYNLPKLTDDGKSHPKLLDVNNASYIDNFFSYLTSKLLHQHNFLHGIDYYGSFLGIQEKFKMNVTDDIDYLHKSTYFNDNIDKLFTLTATENSEFMNFGSRRNKNKLKIDGGSANNLSIDAILIDTLDIDNSIKEDNMLGSGPDTVYVKQESSLNTSSTSTSSTDSSNDSDVDYSSESDNEDEDDPSEGEGESKSDGEESTSESDWETEDEESECTEDSEDSQYAYIDKFPVQLICLEKCDGTLDELFLENRIDSVEAASALFQIIMTLLVYQKAFHFTHNDLHTNNIMYMNTNSKVLYYQYKGQPYRVPTHGKIFKIIDFGRSIYRFNKELLCSDSFASGGDAHTQYNCEPYINTKKPNLPPNYSFDLCRLGCSIYDFIIDEHDIVADFDDLQKTIYRWCLDDNNKNLLYKKNGEERYPNFKLYKMIARTVHNHTPEEQLNFPYFKQFLISKQEDTLQKDSSTYLDIDAIPSYA